MKQKLQLAIPFLLVILLVPVSGMAFAEKNTYALEEINDAFTNAEDHVTYTENTNRMKVDVAALKEDDVSRKDIKIIKQYARTHNQLMKAFLSNGNMTDVVNKVKTGKFSNLFTEQELLVSGQSHTITDIYGLYACGIWSWGSHPDPIAQLSENGFSSKSALQSDLIGNSFHAVSYPWTDRNHVSFDYAKINSSGKGGCTGGEFRDQEFIYAPETHGVAINSVPVSGWYTLTEINEPNPELLTYVPPTLWWDVYVAVWHYNN